MRILNNEDWEDFLLSPSALLILGKNGCDACEKWSDKLQSFEPPAGMQIGKLLLDTPGLGRFKLSQPWVADVDILPFNVIFIDGEIKKSWAGGGLERLKSNLDRYV
tara:strand:- start:1968 stop:2285 length:318 start_codon:yes stop_codon:yes gene_type:complete